MPSIMLGVGLPWEGKWVLRDPFSDDRNDVPNPQFMLSLSVVQVDYVTK